MCHERERLIAYVYDDCDAPERRAVEAHLEECAACRAEMSGFRRVRQDLLAWEVPDHDSVWRPFAPARVAPWWQGVPAWAMAAAALAVFAVGATGGVVTHALMPDGQIAASEPVAERAVATTAVSPAELTALEARVLQAFRAELDTRLELSSAHQVASRDLSEAEARLIRQFRAELVAAERRQVQRFADLEGFVDIVGTDLLKNTSRVNELSRVVAEVTGGPGR